MKLSELYSEYFANWISGGSLIRKDNISLLGIKPLFDRFVTNKFISKVWMVSGMPVDCKYNLTDLIRNEMFLVHPSVRTTVHFCCEPINISVRSNIFMRQFENISAKFHEFQDFFDSLTEEQKLAGVYDVNPKTGKKVWLSSNDMDRVHDEYESYMYVYEQATTGHSFSNMYFFVKASCESRKELKQYQKSLEGLLDKQSVIFSELHGNIDSYLNNFCPATYPQKSKNRFAHLLASDTNITGLLPYKSRGLIGGKGLLMGLDVLGGMPFWLDLFNSGSAQVSLIVGKTGCGKTYFAFALALGLAAMNVHFSAIDIKGGEWTKIAKYIDMLEIAMGDVNSYFVNTMRLDDVCCSTTEDSKEAFDTAVRGTVGTFEVIVSLDEKEGNLADLHSILNKAVMKVFNRIGVIPENPDTFKRTKNLKYANVLDTIQELMLSSSYTEEQKKICKLVILRGSDYFLAEGRYARAMNKELTLQDVINIPAVVYNFNKNKTVTLDTLDSLRVYWVQFLDRKKQSERKKQKLHTAAFYEELQRCQDFGMLVNEISHSVTGSRSNNVIIFLLLNAISTLDAKEFLPIKSNITTKIVGKMATEDVTVMVNSYDCKPIEDYMTKICTDQANRYTNCFAIQYDTGMDTNKVMCRTVMSKSMSEHFNTRDRMVD